jgi:hypothetical protein
MRLSGDITINGTVYPKGSEVGWLKVYPFFLLHMLMFGASGFFMAYGADQAPLLFIYAHGGIAILVYVIFYLAMFGWDEVKWMFINAGLGVVGIYCDIRWLLQLFGKNLDDYPWYLHVTPFLYYVLYTFLLRHMVLDMFNARENPERRVWVERLYVAGSLLISALAYWSTRH